MNISSNNPTATFQVCGQLVQCSTSTNADNQCQQILITTEELFQLTGQNTLTTNNPTIMMMAPVAATVTSGGGGSSGGSVVNHGPAVIAVSANNNNNNSSSNNNNDIGQIIDLQHHQSQSQQLQQGQEFMDDDSENFIDQDSELSTLEGAACQSRLSPDKMSSEEMKAFPDVVENTSLIPIFLHIRNSILKYWLMAPKYQLLLEVVYQRLEQPFNSDPLLVSRIFHFLERHSYINFGVFQINKPLIYAKPKKIAVIGAGIAGLIAARQLKYFGFDVVVLEARDRLGGRIWTYDTKVADVGAFVITGLLGNPIRVIAKQIDLEMRQINQKCPLYLKNSVVDKSKDEVLENVFNSILESTSMMVKEKNINTVDDQPLSLGDGLDIILEAHERQVRLDYLKYLKDLYLFEETLSKNLDKLIELKKTIKELYEKHKEAIHSKVARNPKQEYAFRVNRYDLNRAVELYQQTKDKIQTLEDKIKEYESKNVAVEYLSPIDRRILDWHFANLEFATGTSLNNLSLQHWDLDDDYQFSGPQMYAKDGHNQVALCLATGDYEVKLNQIVRTISLTPQGVDVQTITINDMVGGKSSGKKLTTATTYSVDAVLCTLPLGVLKNSINPPTTTTSTTKSDTSNSWIQFEPPLPDYKCQAINRLGFGNLNKVVLVFEKIFWDINTHLFGNVSQTTENRGELFLFTSVSKQPVLVAFIAGEAADNLEQMDDQTIKKKCLAILTNMYGTISTLKSYFVTRWKSDPWSQGSYSYVAKGATGDDFDLLAEPVALSNNINNNNSQVQKQSSSSSESSSSSTIPRLFFAGEHTIRQYPSTVHGALLSGLREAAKIANQFLGVPYLNNQTTTTTNNSSGNSSKK